MILFKNPVHSALGLLLTFFAMAGIYVLLEAPVVAVFQVAVYAGAIMVLFLFVVMFLNLHDEYGFEATELKRIAWVVLGAGLGLAAALWCLSLQPTVFGETLPQDQAQRLGEALLGRHMMAFELISFLLLGAAVGAVALNRKRSN